MNDQQHYDPRDFMDEERLTAQLSYGSNITVDIKDGELCLLMRKRSHDGSPVLTETRLTRKDAMILARSILDIYEAYER